MVEISPLEIEQGCIQAPAGCGKTHLIAESLKQNSNAKPVLVLTHTNAGVAALRQRLDRNEVPRKHYSLATLDGWSMKVVGMFPRRSGISTSALQLSNPGVDYPAIKASALALLSHGHIQDIIKANYSRLFVDEYQDCMRAQHSIVSYLSEALPTCVFGDVLQGIFDFGDTPVDWNNDVLRTFPLVKDLSTPWRWENAGARHVGEWLLEIRTALMSGGKIDLGQAPNGVSWVPINDENDFENILRATHSLGDRCSSSIIICNSRDRSRQQRIAQCTKGASMVENADLSDLVGFAARFDFSSANATHDLLEEAANLMRGVNAQEVRRRLVSLKAGTNRNPASDAEQSVLAFDSERSPQSAANALSELNRQSGVSVYRPEVLRNLLKALHSCSDAAEFEAMAIRAREERRSHGRAIGKRSVGSTLLVKGLEADQVVLVDTHTFNAKNLYVALTRGAKQITVCSANSLLPVVSPLGLPRLLLC